MNNFHYYTIVEFISRFTYLGTIICNLKVFWVVHVTEIKNEQSINTDLQEKHVHWKPHWTRIFEDMLGVCLWFGKAGKTTALFDYHSFLRAFCHPLILQNELDYKSIRMQLKNTCWHRTKWYIVNSMHTVIVFWSLWLLRKARECHDCLGSLQPYIVFCRLPTYLLRSVFPFWYCTALVLTGQFLGGECGGNGLETFLCHKTLA